jgi:zinc protease
LTASALKEPQNIIDKGPDEKDVAKFKEGELADFRKKKKIDTGYQTH